MNVKHILLDINLSVLPWSELRFQAKDAAHNILIKENYFYKTERAALLSP